MASYSLPSFCSANARDSSSSSSLYLTNGSSNSPKRLRVIKVQCFQEEGKSTSIVDANLNILKERMEMVKAKEGMERCCRSQNGWNYYNYNNNYEEDDLKMKTKALVSNLIELIALVCGTFGCTLLSGTLLLCLFSLIVHLH